MKFKFLHYNKFFRPLNNVFHTFPVIILIFILLYTLVYFKNQKEVKESLAATITVSPGQSIQSAVNSANPGDIIQIRAGIYNQSVSIARSGIKVMGYPGEKPVIDGQNSRSTGISIQGSNITVSNLKVTNHTGHDIDIDRSTAVILDGLEVYITGRAIHIQNSTGITVKNSLITTPTYIERQTDGIYSQRNKNNIYENNYIVIYNSHTGGHDDAIQMYQDESMIVRSNYLAQVNSKTSNAQGLYATTMYGTSKFYNNVVNLGNAQSNALSFRRLPELGGTGTVEIVGNTVVGLRLGHGIWVTETENAIVKNNLVSPGSGAGLTLSTTGSGVSNNLVTSDPKFVNVANQDFHLQSGSPAIDRGASLTTPYNVDKDGRSRPQGPAWDIGAYEYGTGGGPTTIPTSPITQPPSGKPGDVDGDSDVDVLDFQALSNSFGKLPGQTGYNADANFNSDPVIDIFDFQHLSNNFGR